MLLVGDSTLLAVGSYGTLHALQGFDAVYEAASCRTLGVPSCGQNPVPNSVATINAVSGRVDAVVIMAGYDEWWTTFPDSFEAVNAAARAKGARRIIWLTYREGVGYKMPGGISANEAFVKNNQTLRDKVASGANPDVVLADWYRLHVGDSDLAQSRRDPPHVHGRVRRRRLHLAHDRQRRGPAVPAAVGRRRPGRRAVPRP